MTTPNERTHAVLEMAREVQRLEPYMHGNGDTARVPREALRRLYALLRHYPMPSELMVTAQRVPELWAAADEIERLRAEVEMLREDAERLEYLMRHLPGDALRYVAGELADSGDIAEFRAAIDKVMAPNLI